VVDVAFEEFGRGNDIRLDPFVCHHTGGNVHRRLVTRGRRWNRITGLQFSRSDFSNASICDAQHRVVGRHPDRAPASRLNANQMVLARVFRGGRHGLYRPGSAFVDRWHHDLAVEFLYERPEVVGPRVGQPLLDDRFNRVAVPPRRVAVLDLRLRVEAVPPLRGVKVRMRVPDRGRRESDHSSHGRRARVRRHPEHQLADEVVAFGHLVEPVEVIKLLE
jgi:hypothetical protein